MSFKMSDVVTVEVVNSPANLILRRYHGDAIAADMHLSRGDAVEIAVGLLNTSEVGRDKRVVELIASAHEPGMLAERGRERVLEDLQEVRREISRLNQAAGETIFNPAATEGLQALIDDLRADEGAEVAVDIAAGRY